MKVYAHKQSDVPVNSKSHFHFRHRLITMNDNKNKTVNVRTRNNEVLGEKKVDALLKDLKKEIDEKK